jgi:hypothetical protein
MVFMHLFFRPAAGQDALTGKFAFDHRGQLLPVA